MQDSVDNPERDELDAVVAAVPPGVSLRSPRYLQPLLSDRRFSDYLDQPPPQGRPVDCLVARKEPGEPAAAAALRLGREHGATYGVHRDFAHHVVLLRSGPHRAQASP